MILACFSATSRFWYSNDVNSLPQVEDATKCYSNKLIWIELLARSKCSGVSNSWSKYLTANFTIFLFSKTAKDTQKWIWNSCLEWPKAGIRQDLKEIRDKKLENQIFGPRYTLRKSYEFSIYFATHAFILHHWSIFPSPRWNCEQSLT